MTADCLIIVTDPELRKIQTHAQHSLDVETGRRTDWRGGNTAALPSTLQTINQINVSNNYNSYKNLLFSLFSEDHQFFLL